MRFELCFFSQNCIGAATNSFPRELQDLTWASSNGGKKILTKLYESYDGDVRPLGINNTGLFT